MGVCPAAADCKEGAKVTQDWEGGTEDVQLHVSDEPYLNIGRGDMKFIRARDLSAPKRHIAMPSPPLAPVKKIMNFLEGLPCRSPRVMTKATKDTHVKNLVRAHHQRMPCLLSSSLDPKVVIPLFIVPLSPLFFTLPLTDIFAEDPS